MTQEQKFTRYQYPVPKMPADLGAVKRDKGLIGSMEIATSEIRLQVKGSDVFFRGAAHHMPLFLLHKILQSMLRNPDTRWIYSENTRTIHDIYEPDYELPLQRLSPLAPNLKHRKLIKFPLFFTSLTINFHSADSESGLWLCPMGGANHKLKVDDEIHAILRIAEMRHCLGPWEAIGIAAKGKKPGEIYRLIGPNGEIVGENSDLGDDQEPSTEQ